MRCSVPQFFYLVIVLCTSAAAQQETDQVEPPKLDLVGTQWSGVLSPYQISPYKTLINEIIAGSAASINFHMMPIRRANRHFLAHKSDCVFIGVDNQQYYTDNGVPVTYKSIVFNRLYLRVYSPKDKEPLPDKASVEHVRIAVNSGLYNSAVGSKALDNKNVLVANSLDNAFGLVDKGRADVVAAYEADAKRFFKRTRRSHYHADKELSLATVGEAIVCWPSPVARRFIDHANAYLTALETKGELKDRFGFSAD